MRNRLLWGCAIASAAISVMGAEANAGNAAKAQAATTSTKPATLRMMRVATSPTRTSANPTMTPTIDSVTERPVRDRVRAERTEDANFGSSAYNACSI